MMKYFNIALYVFFGFAIIFAVIIFSGKTDIGKSKSDTGASGSVAMWGTIPSAVISPALSEYNNSIEDYSVTYKYIAPGDYEDQLIEAFASGKGPDIYTVTPELLVRFSDKIAPIPFTSYPERSFTDIFISAADVFLQEEGILALPLRADPLVMYYNRDILESNFQVTPPAYWDDMYAFAQTLTKKNEAGVISESAIAFGAWDNVTHAKDILSMMLLQGGNTVTTYEDGVLTSVLNQVSAGSGVKVGPSVVTFYGEFANPSSLYYSWNEAKPESFDAFVAGDLALYFGFASELSTILAKNPNLNFDVVKVPQIKNGSVQKTYIGISGVALSKFSKNPTTAYVVARDITDKSFAEAIAENDTAPSVRRDLLKAAASVDDSYATVFNNSAIIGDTWIDPDASATYSIFRTMIKSYTSGSQSANDAVRAADSALELL
jgi:multiple sugar transport system substrate-binding protein